MQPDKLNKWVAQQVQKARESIHKEYEPMVKAFNEKKFNSEYAHEEGIRIGLTQAGHDALLAVLDVRDKQLSMAIQELKLLSQNNIGAAAILKKIDELGRDNN